MDSDVEDGSEEKKCVCRKRPASTFACCLMAQKAVNRHEHSPISAYENA